MKKANFRIVFDKDNEKTTVFLNFNDGITWMFPIYTTRELLSDVVSMKSMIPSLIDDAIKSFEMNSGKSDCFIKSPSLKT